MGQKEVFQDQLDILATNLELINQKLSSNNQNGKVVQLPPGNTQNIVAEIKKTQQWISTIADHLIKLESKNEEESKNLIKLSESLTLVKKDTTPTPTIYQNVGNLLQEVTNTQKLIKEISPLIGIIPNIDKKIANINLLETINSSLNEVRSNLNSFSSINTKLQNFQDTLENQKELLNTTQSQVIYLQKLQNHHYQELSKIVQQLPYRPVDSNDSQKMLQFPEDEQLTYLQSIRKEISLSKKNSPLMFTLLIISIMMFSLVTLFMIVFFITR